MGIADELRRRAVESFQRAVRARSGQGASAWLTMAQTWLELAQVAERRQSAPAGDALPVTAIPGADTTSRNGEPDGGSAR